MVLEHLQELHQFPIPMLDPLPKIAGQGVWDDGNLQDSIKTPKKH